MVIASMDLDSQVDDYSGDVAQFRHAVCHRRSVRRRRFAATSLIFVAADAYNQLFCDFFSVDIVSFYY